MIFSHDDLTINGQGSLVITANYKHGIDCNDSLRITGGDLTISAPEDALHANDSVRFADCTMHICAGDDAIRCDGEIVAVSGILFIESCNLELNGPDIIMEEGEIRST